jgi:hypothetical protein
MELDPAVVHTCDLKLNRAIPLAIRGGAAGRQIHTDVVLWMLVIWLPSILRIACPSEVVVPHLIAEYTGHGLVCSAL